MARNPLPEELYRRRRTPRDYGVRGDYFRDVTAIIHSQPFRRLKHKTQVFFAPENDHVCTRMEHVLHVSTIAATICKGLNRRGWELDPELAMAIGLGHDVGHAPFGHSGEAVLREQLVGGGGFVHEINSYRVVDRLANYGSGLNLTWAVRDGIVCHNGEAFDRSLTPMAEDKELDAIHDRNHLPSSYEGCVVRIADSIAYLGRDIEDAVIARFISIEDVPQTIRHELGGKNGEIIDTLIEDVISTSHDQPAVGFSAPRHQLVVELKEFNYRFIYQHPELVRYASSCRQILIALIDHFRELLLRFGREYPRYRESGIEADVYFGRYLEALDHVYQDEPPEVILGDYISGMTDNFALRSMEQISLPRPIRFGPW